MNADGKKQWTNSRLPKGNNGNHSPVKPSTRTSQNWPRQSFPVSPPAQDDLASALASVSLNQRGEDVSASSKSARQIRSPNPVSPQEPNNQIDIGPCVDADEGVLEDGNQPQSDEQHDDSDDTEDSIGDQFGSRRGHGTSAGTSAGKYVDDSIAELPLVTEAEFYSNLVFLSILCPTVGPRQRRAKDVEFVNPDNSMSTPNDHTEIQRDFLDRLCYLADYKKGGDSITAAAIQFVYVQQEQQQQAATQIIWFAANAGVSKPAWDALQEVERLIQRNRTENLSENKLAQEICERFTLLASCEDQQQCCDSRLGSKEPGIPKGTHRINFYAKQMRKHGKKVCEWLKRKRLAETRKATGPAEPIESWIDDLRRTPTQLELVMQCYTCWYEEPYKSFLSQAKRPSSDPEASPDLKEFAHYVARLGAHRYAALKVAAGIKKLEYFGKPNCLVKFDKLPKNSHQDVLKPTRIELANAFSRVGGGGDGIGGGNNDDEGGTLAQTDPWNIVHRLSKYFPGEGPSLAGGYLLEETRRSTSGGAVFSFRDEIQQWIRRRGGVLLTRYHAELQVANFFNAVSLSFQNRDRYIGCSKGACWFCFQYLTNLRASRTGGGGGSTRSSWADDGFVEPSRHNEVLPGVSFPPTKSDGKGVVVRMMAKMNDVVLRQIRDVLLGNMQQFSQHHQSTNTWMDHTVPQSSWMDEEDIRSVMR